MKPFAVAIAALALVGCVEQPPSIPPHGGIIPLTPCGADRLQGFVGRPLAALPPGAPDVTRRVIRPGDAVTEDFSLQRLNVYLDRADIITRLNCG